MLLALIALTFGFLSIPSACAQINIGPEADVFASSTSSAHPELYYPARVKDGEVNPDTWREWTNEAPASEVTPARLTLKWPTNRTLRKVVVHTHRGWEVQDFKLEYSVDGASWKPFSNGEFIGNLEFKVEILADSAITAKFLRLSGSRGPEIQPEIIRIVELEVYEDHPSFERRRQEITIHDLQPSAPLCRARRPVVLTAELHNTGSAPQSVKAHLSLPRSVSVLQAPKEQILIPDGGRKSVSWVVEFYQEGNFDLRLAADDGKGGIVSRDLRLHVLPAVTVSRASVVPPPIVPSKATDTLVGAINWPYWSNHVSDFWLQVEKFRERIPALGMYGQETAEVNDWELKWAAEHGIDFFVYNWTRFGKDKPSKEWQFPFGNNHIDQRLTNPVFTSKVKAAVQFNNGTGEAGVKDPDDLIKNVAPYFINNFFKRKDYLIIDKKPALFIYDVNQLIEDFGGTENVKAAFDGVRELCRNAGLGFDGAYIIGEHRFYEVPKQNGRDFDAYKRLKAAGVDFVYAYNNYIGGSPDNETAVRTQMAYYEKAREFNLVPPIITASMGWSGWRNESTVWQLPPQGPHSYQTLLEEIKAVNSTLPETSGLGKKMVLLDNWNEWSEGHYIAPHRQHGFGYLDAVREVFAPGQPHQDFIPEDFGMGPYDTAFWETWYRDEGVLQPEAATKVVRGTLPDPDIVGWWTFDERNDAPIAFDYSGNRLGGIVRRGGNTRTSGRIGSAFNSDGDSGITVASNDTLSPARLTVSAWVWTSVANQRATYILNRMYLGNDSGYRLSIAQGKPVFTVPLSDGSHSVTANVSLPINRWVHLAGTSDGKSVRIYVDGKEEGAISRWGKVVPNDARLIIGNFAEGASRASAFAGLIDDVRIYRRAMLPSEINSLASSPSDNAPKAAPAQLTVVENRVRQVSLLGSHPESATIVTPPSFGTLSGTGSQRTYTPHRGFTGTDSFTFKVSNGTVDSAPATVAITVTPGASDGLEGWWPMDESSGGIVSDAADFSRHGRVSGGTWTTGRIGGAARLSGTNSGVTIPASEGLDGVAAMTIAGWVYVDSMPTSMVTPFSKEGNVPAYRIIFNNTGNLQFVVATSQNPWYSSGTHANAGVNTISAGTWMHLAGTYDGTHVRLYVNGQLKNRAANPISGPIVASNAPLRLGFSNPMPNNEPLKGALDDVRFYNRALSDQEIQQLFQKKAYSVTYNGNGKTGGIEPESQTKTDGVPLILASNSGGLEKTGHTFAGWNTSPQAHGNSFGEGGLYSANEGVTLYAQWNPLTYPVTYSGNGSTEGAAPASQNKIYGKPLILAPNGGSLARSGYKFIGWNSAPDGSEISYSAEGEYTDDAPVTLYAQWLPVTYSVLYNGNGNTGGSEPNTQNKIHDVELALRENSGGLSRSGYTFAGWNTKKDGSGRSYAAGENYPANTPLSLYAQWTPEIYPVRYNGNGKTQGAEPVAQSKVHDQDLKLATNSGGLGRSGYTFAGWNTSSEGSGVHYAEGELYSANMPVTLYAQWKPITYSVVFDGNGNSRGSVPADQSKLHGIPLAVSPNNGKLWKRGFTFVGWNTNPDGTGQTFSDGKPYTENRPITLYAKWIPVGLVGWWRLNEDNGPEVADFTDNQHTGMHQGGTWKEGKKDGALQLEGGDSHISIPDGPGLDGMSELTLGGWVRLTQKPSQNVSLVSKEGRTNPAFRIFITPTGRVHFTIATRTRGWYQHPGNSVESSDDVITIGNWHSVFGTYDGEKLRLYVDGVIVGEGSTSGAIVDNSAPLTFGLADPTIRVSPLIGTLDDLRLYNRALTPSKIRALTQEPGLIGLWRLENRSGSMIRDATTNGHHGIQEGGSWSSGLIGGALLLNGERGSGVIIADATRLDGMSALTVGGWVQLSRNRSKNISLVSKEGPSNPAFRIFITPQGSVHFSIATQHCGWYQARGNSLNTAQNLITVGRWHSVFGTYDGQKIRIYVDGRLAGEGLAPISGSIVSNDAPLTFGIADPIAFSHERPSIDLEALPGFLDDMRMYNRALPEREIEDMIEGAKPSQAR